MDVDRSGLSEEHAMEWRNEYGLNQLLSACWEKRNNLNHAKG
jgi:hypothetical protein